LTPQQCHATIEEKHTDKALAHDAVTRRTGKQGKQGGGMRVVMLQQYTSEAGPMRYVAQR